MANSHKMDIDTTIRFWVLPGEEERPTPGVLMEGVSHDFCPRSDVVLTTGTLREILGL